jgi:hypothetical protein
LSLKGFHVLLISLSSLLGLVFAGWSFHAFRATGRGAHLALAALSLAVAAGLAVYVVWFARRIRTRDEEDRRRRKLIHPLAVLAGSLLLSPRPAGACAVCYGEAQGPMIDAARLGVFLLFGLVFAVQVGFVGFFLRLGRRAREHAAGPSQPGHGARHR